MFEIQIAFSLIVPESSEFFSYSLCSDSFVQHLSVITIRTIYFTLLHMYILSVLEEEGDLLEDVPLFLSCASLLCQQLQAEFFHFLY